MFFFNPVNPSVKEIQHVISHTFFLIAGYVVLLKALSPENLCESGDTIILLIPNKLLKREKYCSGS